MVGWFTFAASGARCSEGFLKAPFSKAATVYKLTPEGGAGLVVSAAVGGTAAALGGGNFANGAVTAAFGYLFNAMSGKYNKNTGTLMLRDLETEETMSVAVFSGDGKNRPIPNGWYLIAQHRNEDWFRLEPIDAVLGNDMIDGGDQTGRRLFRLHEGTLSEGCITIIDDARDLTAAIRGTRVTGTLQAMRPDNWVNRIFRSPTEVLKVYGVIQVTGNDPK